MLGCNGDISVPLHLIATAGPVSGQGVLSGMIESVTAPLLVPEKATTLCATLGDDQPPSLLDQDLFTLTSAPGETITITLEALSSVPPPGKRVTLLLTDQIAKVFFARIDSSAKSGAYQHATKKVVKRCGRETIAS